MERLIDQNLKGHVEASTTPAPTLGAQALVELELVHGALPARLALAREEVHVRRPVVEACAVVFSDGPSRFDARRGDH